MHEIDEVVWELPPGARGYAGPGADVRRPRADRANRSRPIARPAAERRDAAGIVGAALAMPDMHQGYGFPTSTAACGCSPSQSLPPLGGRTEALAHEISRRGPVGAGHGGSLKLADVGARSRACAGTAGVARLARDRHRGGHRAHGVRWLPSRGAFGSGVRRARALGSDSSGRSDRETTSSRFTASHGSSIPRAPPGSG